MPIIGFNLEKIGVERFNVIKGQVNVKTTLKVTNIKEQKVEGLSNERTALKFDFTLDIDYEPKVARIEFKGHVLDLEENKQAKKILTDWKKKKVEEELNMRIRNTIWIKCSVKAFLLEEEIGLPVHIPIPRMAPAKSGSYVG